MFKFGQIAAKQGNVQFDLSVTPERRAATFTFSEFEIKVQGGKAAAATSARSASLLLPLEGDEERVEIEFIP